MPLIRLGNSSAVDRGQPLPGNRVTTVQVRDEDDTETRVRTITHADGLWPRMSMAPAAWVECPGDSELESALSEFFNCPVGEPADWSE